MPRPVAALLLACLLFSVPSLAANGQWKLGRCGDIALLVPAGLPALGEEATRQMLEEAARLVRARRR